MADVPVHSCRVCGAPAPASCVQCKVAHYCGAAHQRVDWKAEHKRECCALPLTCAPPPRRAIFVTCAIDTTRIDARVAAVFAAEKMRFVMPLFFCTADPTMTGRSQLSLLIMHARARNDIHSVADLVSVALERSVANGVGADEIFLYPLDDRAAGATQTCGLAPGLEAAAAASLETFKDLLHDARDLGDCDSMLTAVLNAYAASGTPGWVFGSGREKHATEAHAREARTFDAAFLGRVEECAPSYAPDLPLGSKTTVFHFSHGKFHKRLDFAACHRGLLPERVACLVPKPAVFDCRLARAPRVAK